MLVPKYKIVSFLDNKTYSLIEIKYTEFNYQANTEKNYWLLYDKNNDMLMPLELLSSSNTKDKQIKKFEDSDLEFDNKKGTYNNGKLVSELSTQDPTKPVYKKLKEAIDDYILLLSFRK